MDGDLRRERDTTLERIKPHILSGDLTAAEDFFQYLRVLKKEGGYDYKDVIWLRGQLTKLMDVDAIKAYDLMKRSYLLTAKDNFEDYLVYLEWDRAPKEKFYLPRKKVLHNVAVALQMLADGNLDELFLSQPPRTGKTSMMLFYVTWLIGRDSERSNLYSAFSDTITKAFYNGVLEILNDPVTYLWKDVFPNASIASTNMQEETLNIDRRKRYASLTCRSLYGTLNGAVDCDGVVISDDLIGGIEEALNKDRLVSAWGKVDNNLLPRAKQGAKLLWIGTRWSQSDPIGIRLDTLQNDSRFAGRRYKVINLPAVDERGESNFNYDYGVGFDTTFYLQRKASFDKTNDMASWYAQYMGEPIERSGTLFEPQDMKYFNGDLPESGLVRRFMAVDPAFGGGDFCSAPICYQYENGDVYVVDVVYSNASKRFTQPLLCQRIKQWEVQACQFECTKMTAAFKEAVEDMLHKDGYRCNITYKAAPVAVAKEVRIFDKAPEIKEFYFLEGTKRTREYDQFMNNVFSFKISGGNRHDDAPDSLAMAVDMMGGIGQNIMVRRRWF